MGSVACLLNPNSMNVTLNSDYAWVIFAIFVLLIIYFLIKGTYFIYQTIENWKVRKLRNSFCKDVTRTEFVTPTISSQNGSKCTKCGCQKDDGSSKPISSQRIS